MGSYITIPASILTEECSRALEEIKRERQRRLERMGVKLATRWNSFRKLLFMKSKWTSRSAIDYLEKQWKIGGLTEASLDYDGCISAGAYDEAIIKKLLKLAKKASKISDIKKDDKYGDVRIAGSDWAALHKWSKQAS